MEVNLKLDQLNMMKTELPLTFDALKDKLWQAASVHVPHKMRYGINLFPVECVFLDPETN